MIGAFRSRVLAAAAALALGACSFSRDIAEHSLEYNRAVERFESEMILLNIVRASKNYPMFFTRLSSITGNLEGSASGALVAPFGGDAADIFTSTLSLSGSSKPSFTVQVLDSQEFYEGFLTPVTEEMLEQFLAAGWPGRIVYTLLVERADIHVEGDDRACRIEGDPSRREYWVSFEALVELLNAGPRIRSGRGPTVSIGPPLPESIIRDADMLATLHGAGIRVESTGGGRVRLTREPRVFRFGSSGAAISPAAERALAAPVIPYCDQGYSHRLRNWLVALREGRPTEVSMSVYLRSPQGIFYLLGELARASLDNGGAPVFETGFALRRGEPPARAAISVAHEGAVYWVPSFEDTSCGVDDAAPCIRTSQYITFARQVFSLSTQADDRPPVGVVRFLN